MGLVAGEILEQRTCQRTGRREYFGPLLNQVARVARAAHGGQVLTNEHTFNCYRQEARSQLQPEVEPRARELSLIIIAVGERFVNWYRCLGQPRRVPDDPSKRSELA